MSMARVTYLVKVSLLLYHANGSGKFSRKKKRKAGWKLSSTSAKPLRLSVAFFRCVRHLECSLSIAARSYMDVDDHAVREEGRGAGGGRTDSLLAFDSSQKLCALGR